MISYHTISYHIGIDPRGTLDDAGLRALAEVSAGTGVLAEIRIVIIITIILIIIVIRIIIVITTII